MIQPIHYTAECPACNAIVSYDPDGEDMIVCQECGEGFQATSDEREMI